MTTRLQRSRLKDQSLEDDVHSSSAHHPISAMELSTSWPAGRGRSAATHCYKTLDRPGSSGRSTTSRTAQSEDRLAPPPAEKKAEESKQPLPFRARAWCVSNVDHRACCADELTLSCHS